MATIASAPLHAKRIRADPIPNIQNAGKIIATGGTTADHSIRPEVHAYINAGNTGTPPHIKKYRKLNNASPGQIIVHPGLQVGQPNLPGAYIFGKKTQFSDPVKEIVKAQN